MDNTSTKKARAAYNNLKTCCDGRAKRDGLAWGEAQHATKDPSNWKQTIDALYPTREKDDQRNMEHNSPWIVRSIFFLAPNALIPSSLRSSSVRVIKVGKSTLKSENVCSSIHCHSLSVRGSRGCLIQ